MRRGKTLRNLGGRMTGYRYDCVNGHRLCATDRTLKCHAAQTNSNSTTRARQRRHKR